MDNPSSTPETSIVGASASGSRVVSIYVERKMKILAIPETEFDTVSLMSAATTVAFAIGSFFLNMSMGIVEKQVSITNTPIFLASMAFFIAGVIALVSKRGITKKIKRDSITITT